MPAAHVEQSLEPTAENSPLAQLSQFEARLLECLPASQSVHEDDELPLYRPASHGEHAVEFFADHFPPSAGGWVWNIVFESRTIFFLRFKFKLKFHRNFNLNSPHDVHVAEAFSRPV